MKKKLEIESSPTPEIKSVFIKRESHLGYRAYELSIVNGKATVTPLHNSPDLQAIALGVASDWLGRQL